LNVYYVYGMSLDLDLLPVSREEIHAALVAEGLIIGKTFQNVHLMPIYQKKIAYGSSGFPWSSEICKREVSYDKGICPIAEKMQDECFLAIGLCNFDFDESDIDLIIGAFQKVWKNLDKLK